MNIGVLNIFAIILILIDLYIVYRIRLKKIRQRRLARRKRRQNQLNVSAMTMNDAPYIVNDRQEPVPVGQNQHNASTMTMNTTSYNISAQQTQAPVAQSQHHVRTMQIDLTLYNNNPPHTLTSASGMHQGTREYQQDSLYVDGSISFLDKDEAMLLGIVCDGMGGMESGEESSKIAVETVKEAFHGKQPIGDVQQFLIDTIRLANKKVNDFTSGNGGTTLITVVIEHNKLYWGSVGDSRIYILRKREIAQLTRDHNYFLTLMEQVGRKEISEKEARKHPKKDALISFIGMDKLELIDISPSPFALQAGDIALLCSDGLSKTLSDAEIAEIVFDNYGDLNEAARLLPIEAFDRSVNGQDNIAVVLIQYDK